MVTFNAITKQKPENAIKHCTLFPREYPTLSLTFVSDFNCPQSHTVLISLIKMEYQSILVGQKTSHKQKYKNNNYIASEYNNIL